MAANHSTGLAVLESRWDDEGNDSVRPVFEMLSAMVAGNPHAFKYDMFSGSSSFVEIVKEVCESGRYHSLYVASHGDDSRICGHNADLVPAASVSRSRIRHAIAKHNYGRTLRGLYFGTCETGNEDLAFHVLHETNLVWIAGYRTAIDWIDSTALDMMFWYRYLRARESYKGYHTPLAEREIVLTAAKGLASIVPYAYSRMGFRVFTNNGTMVETFDGSDET